MASSSATTSTSRTARRPTCCWPSVWPRAGELRGEAFNFSNEPQVTVLELVQRILALMGPDLEPDVRNEATNEIRHQYLSAAKARASCSAGQPLFALDEGLARTIDWYQEFLDSDDSLRPSRSATRSSSWWPSTTRRPFRRASSCRARRPCRCRAASSTPRRCSTWWMRASTSG